MTNTQELWEVRAYNWEHGEKKLREWISGVTKEKSRDIHTQWYLQGYAMVESNKVKKAIYIGL